MVKEMNIYDIKNKANEVLRQPNQLFKVILYVGIIQALFSALSGLFDGILGSIISLILSILTVTLGHGIIVASLKVVNNNGNLVDEKEDSLVGIKRFGQLFPTYFLYRVVVALAGIVVGVIGMLLMYTMITDAQFSNLSQLVLMYVNKSTISQDEIVNIVASLSNVFSFVFILVIIISILSVYLSLKFGLFNYILQKYNYTGLTALKESSRLMKGNKWTLFKLEFSFFGWIFMNPTIVKENEMDEILTHELAHVKQKHSVDILIAEIVSICCWINPFVWLIKREVRLNLEFLADKKVMEAGFSTKSYQYHLLGLAYNHKYGLSNNFNFSHLKQRIIMMNKKKSNGAVHIKYALFTLPAFALLVAGNISCSQDVSEKTDTKEEVVTPVSPDAAETPAENPAEEKAFDVVEQMPEYSGGMQELMTFLQENIKYPKSAQERKVEGRVIVQFVVEKDGTPTEFNVVRSIDPTLDEEALRVLKAMPKWKPGMQKGQPVRVKYTIPVSFKLKKFLLLSPL